MDKSLDRSSPALVVASPPSGPEPAGAPKHAHEKKKPRVAGEPRPEAGPDPRVLIRRAVAHWPAVFVALVLGAVVTSQVVRIRKPMFKSETVVFYTEGIAKNVTGPTETGESLRLLGAKLKEMLLAQQSLRKIIDENHLYPDIVGRSGYADAVEQMRKRTEFKSRSQDTFAISFEGTTREEAQQVCARMAELLVSETAKRQVEDMKAAATFLDVEKGRADDELAAREKEVSEFLALHPEFAGARDALGTETLAEQKRTEDEEKKRLSQRRPWGSIARGGSDPGLGRLANAPAVDPVLMATRSQAASELFAARKELDQKSLKFTEQHPDVHAAAARVEAAEAALRRADQAILAAQPPPPPIMAGPPPEATVKPSSPVVAAAQPGEASKPRAPDADNKNVGLEMEWSRLSRQVGLARLHQSDLEHKLYRASMLSSTAQSGHGTKIVLLDPAYLPSGPSNAPNRTILLLGFAVSLAVGILISIGWGLLLDDRLFAPSEIEAVVGVPLLGVVPRAAKRDARG